MIKNIYKYFCGDYWSNVWNVMLMEYYVYLFLWFPLAFNS